MTFRPLILVPVYNNEATIAKVVLAAQEHGPLLVVDDGSTDGTAEQLASTGVKVLTLPENIGKGGALIEGFSWAMAHDYTHVAVLDGDGQHHPEDLPQMLLASEQNLEALVVGVRAFKENVPRSSRFGRWFSNLWIKLETGFDVLDSQSGFRVYPLSFFKASAFICRRYDFEIEVMVRFFWQGAKLEEREIDVYYPPAEERVSHFKKGKDNLRISQLHTRLIFEKVIAGVLSPWQTLKVVHRKAMASMTERADPNVLGWSVFVGMMIGVSPLYGFQIALTVALGMMLRLNVPVALLAAHISIPPMIPFLVYASLELGHFALTGTRFEGLSQELSLQHAGEFFGAWAVGGVLLGLLLGIPLAIFTQQWAKRHQARTSDWDGRTKGGQVGYAFFVWILKIFGRRSAYLFLYGVAFFYFCVDGKSRVAGRAFLKRARPDCHPFELWTYSYRQFVNFGQIIIDKIYYLSQGKMPDMTFFEDRTIEIMDHDQNGGLLLSGHFGAWELGAKLAPDWYAPAINVLMHEAEHEKMKEYLNKIQGDGSRLVKVIPAGNGFSVYLDIYKALKSRELVTMHADRSMSGRCLELPFFGEMATFPEDPFVMAAKLKCIVMIAFVHRCKDGSYHFEGHKIEPDDAMWADLNREDRVQWYAKEYVALYERKLRAVPEQWFNFYDFWQVSPEQNTSTDKTGKA